MKYCLFAVVLLLLGCGSIFYNNDDFGGSGGVSSNGSHDGDISFTQTPAEGLYANDKIGLDLSTSGGDSIQYTTDGTDPNSPMASIYTNQLNISSGTRVKAIVFSNGIIVGNFDYLMETAIDGSEAYPYTVTKWEHLSNICYNPDKHFRQDGDIDLGSIANWVPIPSAASTTSPFAGVYDGNGFTIYNLTIVNRAKAGLFAICNYSLLKNVKLSGVNMSSILDNSGALAAAVANFFSGNQLLC